MTVASLAVGSTVMTEACVPAAVRMLTRVVVRTKSPITMAPDAAVCVTVIVPVKVADAGIEVLVVVLVDVLVDTVDVAVAVEDEGGEEVGVRVGVIVMVDVDVETGVTLPGRTSR